MNFRLRRRLGGALAWLRREYHARYFPLVALKSCLAAGLALLIVAWSFHFFFAVALAGFQPFRWLAAPETRCSENGLSCAFAAGFLAPILSLALAYAFFVIWRVRMVRRPMVTTARRHPEDLVESAGRLTPPVVGRDDLCQVLADSLHDPDLRRPHLLVGGVGTGKTAVLVQLTKLLADRGAVPVPLRLRDVQESEALDFRELAYRRFISQVQPRLYSDGEGEKVWRRLCRDDLVVVLADGLEECLQNGDVNNRDNVIRLAVRRACENDLPLVITSRPHEALRTVAAVTMELEPLSEQAALDYLASSGAGGEDQRRLDWVVTTAEVTESPIYLRIASTLHRVGLDRTGTRWAEHLLDTRHADRARLRWQLLDTWRRALVAGHLFPEPQLDAQQRTRALATLSALACVGLREDTLDVGFSDFLGPTPEPPGCTTPAGPYHVLRNWLARELGRTVSSSDLLAAAMVGEQLDLVELHPRGIRFQHSIVQAFLGSLILSEVLADSQDYLTQDLNDPLRQDDLGREFLIAAVLASRADPPGRLDGQAMVQRLLSRADSCDEARAIKLVDAFAAAFEIDCSTAEPKIGRIAERLDERWDDVTAASDQRSLEAAKLRLVGCIGAAARALSERSVREGDRRLGEEVRSAYRQLYKIGCKERCYQVRFTIAQELGAGGADARAELLPELCEAWTAGTEVLASSTEQQWNGLVICAWVTPLLVGPMPQDPPDSWRKLAGWLQGWGRFDRGLLCRTASFEIALAQGFKFAANRGPSHPDAPKSARAVLAEAALGMLKHSRFWFAQLTLLQALALWTLSETGRHHASQGHGSHPADTVRQWCELITEHGGPDGRSELHPFVARAAGLAVRALDEGTPEQFLWIDEAGVLNQVGSRANVPIERRGLWIPRSTGWVALVPEARQLVADVILLLTLADRGSAPDERERHLQRTARTDLPPCLGADRSSLDLRLTVGGADSPLPGETCDDSCEFRLCPYPPKGTVGIRAELTEAFSRQQRVRRPGGRPAFPSDRGIRAFWQEMISRARGLPRRD